MGTVLHRFFLIFSIGLYSLTAWADEVKNSQEINTDTQNSEEKSSGIGTAQDWGLTPDEWAQYQQLMQGVNGHWYPQLTPPAVLGLNAKSPEEQQRLAEITARQEHDKVTKELKFNQALFTALRKLYADEPMIQDFDKTVFNPEKTTHPKQILLQPGNHLAFFVNTQQGLDATTLPKLLALLQTHSQITLDIYSLGDADHTAINAWAALNRIPADLVETGRITLNQDNGKLAKTAGTVSIPYLLLVSHSQSKPVTVADL